VHSADRSPGRRGFTLVELIVALVIGSILITVVLRMVTGQTRFASVQTAREEVQQNARGALEIVGSELRTALAPGLISATAEGIDLMLPRAWGVVCDAGATLRVVFPDIPDLTLPAGDQSGVMVRLADGTWMGRSGARITYTAAPQAFTVAAGTCGADVTVQGLGRSFSTSALPTAPASGNLVMVYERVRYAVGDVGGDLWLQRSLGWTGTQPNMQPVAGPVAPGTARFTYFDQAQAEMSPVPGTNAALLDAVRMVRFDVRMLSRQRLDGSIRQAEEGSITVQLRNW
jgi:prepilin-type N-terminal cleavage/methylation domain-containing protein